MEWLLNDGQEILATLSMQNYLEVFLKPFEIICITIFKISFQETALTRLFFKNPIKRGALEFILFLVTG